MSQKHPLTSFTENMEMAQNSFEHLIIAMNNFSTDLKLAMSTIGGIKSPILPEHITMSIIEQARRGELCGKFTIALARDMTAYELAGSSEDFMGECAQMIKEFIDLKIGEYCADYEIKDMVSRASDDNFMITYKFKLECTFINTFELVLKRMGVE